jgi:heat shock protein HslJ
LARLAPKFSETKMSRWHGPIDRRPSLVALFASSAVALLQVALAIGCGKPRQSPASPENEVATAAREEATTTAPIALAGSRWRLVELQSMDDSIGVVKPDDPSRYTMALGADGKVSMRLDCNRGTGTWSAEPSDDGASGSFTLGPMAMTRAMCPPGSLDTRIAREASYVRSFVLEDGRLHLSLMADGGIQVWEPDPGE